MKKRLLFLLGLMLAISAVSFAQVKTITNADLEKFKQRRLKAEKELRENYKELGFSSPEERKRRNEKSRRELSELADKLRKQELEREKNRTRNSRSNYSDSNYYENSYSDSDARTQADFTDYQSYRVNTYVQRRYRRYFNNRYRRNQRFYKNNNRIRFRGYIGPNVRPRNNRFGPSRRLTRQNNRKTRQNNAGFRIFLGGRIN